ncbi:MAG: hypothetical protein R3C99_06885 [Pirellulaceae bacterium]
MAANATTQGHRALAAAGKRTNNSDRSVDARTSHLIRVVARGGHADIERNRHGQVNLAGSANSAHFRFRASIVCDVSSMSGTVLESNDELVSCT